jgi:tRNA (guanosine-2'-O-)-methyltransferase
MEPRRVIEVLGELLLPERRERLDRIAAARLGGVVVVLEDLHDPHNGGAALRSCEAMGLAEVHVVGERLRFSERVTQGCEKWLEVVQHAEIERCAAGLKARGFLLCAAVPGASTPLAALDPLRPTAFLVGNEHLGLSARARAACDVEYAIPMHGFSQSVNLSVAVAVTVFTHTERRRAALGRAGDLDDEARLALQASYYRRDVRGAEAILARAGA